MPRNAIHTGNVDHVLPLRDIPVLLSALVEEDAVPVRPRPSHPHLVPLESDLGSMPLATHADDRPGRPSVFTCPECHGTLWEADDEGILRFRCRVGHVYSPESMIAAQTDEVDRALWIALRTLDERAALAHRLAERGRERGQHWVDQAFTTRAREAELDANGIRELLRSRAAAGHSVPDSGSLNAGPGPVDVDQLKES
jgi:two-component system chemotaxis response regulator CheB